MRQRIGVSAVVALMGAMAVGSPAAAKDKEVEVYFQNFETEAHGWTFVDMTEAGAGVFWQQALYDDGVTLRSAAMAFSDDECYANSPGYGNGWVQRLTSPPLHIPDNPDEPALLEVDLAYSVEGSVEYGFDFVFIAVSSDGGETFDDKAALTGFSAGIETVEVDMSEYRGQEVLIRIEVTSDPYYSDQDGFWPSNGYAAAVTEVKLSGYPTFEFENGLDGWEATDGLVPNGRKFRRDLVGPDAYPGWPYGHSLVAYDAETGSMPFPDYDSPAFMPAAWSPAIPIPPAEAYVLEFDLYWDQAVFWTHFVAFGWDVSSGDDLPCLEFQRMLWNVWPDNGLFHMRYDSRNGKSFPVPAGAQSIVIELRAVDWDALVGLGRVTERGSGPIFDNVRVLAVNPTLAP